MIPKSNTTKSLAKLLPSSCYSFSKFSQLIFLLRGFLNRIANQDKSQYLKKMLQADRKNLPAQKSSQPTNMAEETANFQKKQMSISESEKNRLYRLDEMLQTKTYFHQTRLYEQRISHDSVMLISTLYQNHRPSSREKVDALNPQMIGNLKMRNMRRNIKWVSKNLKKYPKGLQQMDPNDNIFNPSNQQMFRFLSEEALYTRISLNQLKFTEESLHKEIIYQQQNGEVYDIQEQQATFIYRDQIYFLPSFAMSIYRMDIQQYKRKFRDSIQSLTQALANKTGHIQEVVTIEQIYDCLKEYYYDERVSQYLKKLENSEIKYFLSNLKISPDGSSVFMVIDLLDNKKQYIGIFKKIVGKDLDSGSILKENVVFNIRQQVSLRDKGHVYVIQRNEEGLFVELIKIRFSNLQSPSKSEKSISEGQKKVAQRTIKASLLFKCKPHEQMKIVENGQAVWSVAHHSTPTQNVLFQVKQIGRRSNKVYYIEHDPNTSQENQPIPYMITANNSNLNSLFEKEKVKDRFKHIENWQTNENNLYSECFEIINIGYAVIRYNFIPKQNFSYLKFGFHEQYATYITLIPFEDYEDNDEDGKIKLIGNQQANLLEDKQKANQLIHLNQEAIPSLQLNIENSGNHQTLGNSMKRQKLNPSRQKIIFVSKDLHYFYHAEIKYSSNSNIYFLMNTSVYSVYNRNSLFVYPLRRGVQPYSFYLDGFPIEVIRNYIGSGQAGKVQMKLHTPLLPIHMTFTLWKKEITEVLNKRIYSQTITIKEREQGNIVIKVLTSSRYIGKQIKEQYNQPVILYLPSKNEKLDDILIQKMIEKGVTFIQIVQSRGIFGSNMVQFLRGSRSNYENYIKDIYQTLIFIKQHIANHIGIYAQGASSSFATLFLNITENHQNQLFDCSVLHEGLYDLDQIGKKEEPFFGNDPKVFQKVNLYKSPVFTPTKSIESQQVDKIIISKLQNILFCSLSEGERQQSRKFINKLRQQRSIVYDTVYLKEFDTVEEKDSFNLAFLFKTMNDSLQKQYKQQMKQKYDKLKQKEEGRARDSRKFTHHNEQ